MARILLLGPSGQIGYELRRALSNMGEVTTAGRTEADFALDLSYPSQIENVLHEARAELVVNAAAYTAVDRAESERELAFAINAEAPAVMARMTRHNGSLLVHFSTDYVFNGDSESAYTEADETGPETVYGQSKLEGERAIQSSGARHLILRTSWVYGLRGKNFLRTVLKLAAEEKRLRIVDDQYGTPNWSRALAEATVAVLLALKSDSARIDDLLGLYHLSATGETTWCGFASEILESVKEEEGIRAKKVKAIATKDYPTPAKRPKRSTLNSSKLAKNLGVTLSHWRDCLQQCLDSRTA